MLREVIIPESEEHWLRLRAECLNSTDIAALFNLSPYKTAFELYWEKKSGERTSIADNPRMVWGRRLEAVVAAGIMDDRNWCGRPMKEYIRLPGLRIGSSFDFRARPRPVTSGQDTPDDFILEIKTVDFLAFRDGWTIDEGFIEAPPHIELQVQHQMLVSGLRTAYIGVMVGGNRIEVIERLADDAVHAGILARAAEFWQSIADGNAPDPVMPDDAEAVIRMNQFAEPGKLLDARGDAELATLLQEYSELGKVARDAEEARQVRKAEILQRIGTAEKVFAPNGKISAGITGPAEVAYTRAAFRNFRFTPAKQPAQEAAE
ncbi:YqaJ viral recombinase family protein [Luteibacter sp.]|uniref:YqaJ viral recombinase family nuclease n=1 Tax=Luteibacter sp. TaxID=1886636 RepID=UPI0028083AAE|nr:YqaJ viral recombinase family protein [Luteibacter sp.]MDQ8050699.1 YqaJ viral recombinase family protein [Luteibacter sp.]